MVERLLVCGVTGATKSYRGRPAEAVSVAPTTCPKGGTHGGTARAVIFTTARLVRVTGVGGGLTRSRLTRDAEAAV